MVEHGTATCWSVSAEYLDWCWLLHAHAGEADLDGAAQVQVTKALDVADINLHKRLVGWVHGE